MKKMMYVVREYYIDNPSPEKYYRATREECERLKEELMNEDEDIDEIIISDEPEEVDLV